MGSGPTSGPGSQCGLSTPGPPWAPSFLSVWLGADHFHGHHCLDPPALQRLFKNSCVFLSVTLPASSYHELSISCPQPLPHSFILSFILSLELSPHQVPSLRGVGGLASPDPRSLGYSFISGWERVSDRC